VISLYKSNKGAFSGKKAPGYFSPEIEIEIEIEMKFEIAIEIKSSPQSRLQDISRLRLKGDIAYERC